MKPQRYVTRCDCSFDEEHMIPDESGEWVKLEHVIEGSLELLHWKPIHLAPTGGRSLLLIDCDDPMAQAFGFWNHREGCWVDRSDGAPMGVVTHFAELPMGPGGEG